MRVILASQSEGRKQLMDSLNIKYDIIPSHIDEKAIRHDNPLALVKNIAEAKARAITIQNSLVIGGDVVVVCDKEIMEKPVDNKDAERMLKKLSGKTFDVVAGFAVYNTKTKNIISEADTTKVTFRKLSIKEIRDYIANCHVTKYAGAFEQDGLLRFAQHIEGSPSTITGLPMQKLIPVLRSSLD
jgi:septum formation protein